MRTLTILTTTLLLPATSAYASVESMAAPRDGDRNCATAQENNNFALWRPANGRLVIGGEGKAKFEFYGHGIDLSPDAQLTGISGASARRVDGRSGAVNGARGCGNIGSIKPGEKADSAVHFLQAAVAYYKNLGVTITRVMTDNGSCYKASALRDACRDLGIKHIRTKPYTPKTNGKAERFIQTALREWAYAQAYQTSDQRGEELPVWLHKYNWHRPHGGIKSQTPISRLGLSEDNLLRHNS